MEKVSIVVSVVALIAVFWGLIYVLIHPKTLNKLRDKFFND